VPSENTEQRKLAAIMFTDMVGYSAVSQRNEALALASLAENQRLVRTQFPLFNGREVMTAGDGFLVEFPSALHATRCAVEIQRTMVARNATQPAERQIQVRIGIHVGEVVHREADMSGDGVNIAMRIEPLAIGGGICLSDTVYAQVRNKLELPVTKLAPRQLKNIDTPMEVYRVVLPWEAGAKNAGVSENRPRIPSSMRWFIWGVAALVGLNLLLFWKFVISSGSTKAIPKIQPILPRR
jgi:class 3 adenylate cyclase